MTNFYSEGSLQASIALVGEAPGTTEEKLRRPFIGKAGRLLESLMATAGIQRSDCYITNVVKEHPFGNSIKPFLDIRGSKVEEGPKWQYYCQLLKAELEQSQANVIVALGGTAWYALTRLTHITKWRGSVIPSTLLPGRKVLACIHPSAALERGNELVAGESTRKPYLIRYYISYDLKRALAESASPELNLPERVMHLLPSFKYAMQYMQEILEESQQVGFDIECLNGELYCFALAKTATDIICIPLVSNGTDWFSPDQELEILKQLGRILERPDIAIVGQNLIFDASFMFHHYGLVTNNVQDTMVAEAILNPDFPKGLDLITSIYTAEPYYKADGKQWKKLGMPESVFYQYNCRDAAVCMEALPMMLAQLARTGNQLWYTDALADLHAAMFMQEAGIATDEGKRQETLVEAQRDLVNLQAQLDTLTGEPLNVNSSPQMQRYFYKTKGYKPCTRKGKVTVDDDALETLRQRGAPEPPIIQDIRELRKLIGTYIDAPLDSDKRVRGAYDLVGTRFGRFSSSKTLWGTGLAMQNLDPRVNEYLVADPGMAFLYADLEQAENRYVAYDSQCAAMMAAFENGTDIHSLTATYIIFEETGQRQPADRKVIGEANRQKGKAANHGLNYREGVNEFARNYRLDRRTAATIIRVYFSAYPEVRRWQDQKEQELKQQGFVTGLNGYRYYFRDRITHKLGNEAISAGPQGTIGSHMRKYGVRWAYDNLPTWKLSNTIHDSIIIQFPLDQPFEQTAEEMLALKQSLETPIPCHGGSFSIPLELMTGRTLGKKGLVSLDASASGAGLSRQLHDIYSV